MIIIDLASAKARLSELLDKVEDGEEVVITRNGREVARLTPTKTPKKPLPLEELAKFRASMPRLKRSAVDLLREDREDRV